MDLFGDFKKGIAKLQAGMYDEAETRAELDRTISRKPCVMYSFSSCPFCKQAKGVLSDMGAMYTVIELDEVENGMALRSELAGITGRTSMPAVFAGGKFLGGCNDGGEGGITRLKADGRLEEILAKAGAWSPTQRI